MKLRVTYRPESGDPVNLQVTADATATAGDVARALAKGPGADAIVPDADPLTLKITDQAGRPTLLPGEQPVIHSGLVSGATVELVRAPRRPEPGDAVALLRVIAGPGQGIEVPLLAGYSVIGRANDCHVRLSDPLVSKHHARIEIRDGIEIVDTNSSNGVVVGGVRVQRVAVGPNDVVQLGDTLLSVQVTRPLPGATATTDIDFVRPPLVLKRRKPTKVQLPQPPSDVETARFPWLAIAALMVMGVIMFAVTQSLVGVVFIVVSPLMMLGSWLDQRLENRRRRKEAAAVFSEHLSRAESQLVQIFHEQRQQLEAAHPSVSGCVQAISSLGDLLWCRRPEHPEFLQVRLGLGDVSPLVEFENPEAPGREEFVRPRDEVLRKYARLTNAPIVADLREVGGIGVSGGGGLAEGVARAIVAQVVALHAPSEVVLACLTSALGRARWLWAEWLPHSMSPHSPIGPVQLSSDPASGRKLLDRLEDLVAGRLADSEAREPRTMPAVLVIVDQPPVDVGRLTRLAEQGPAAGVHVLWVASHWRLLPAACRGFVDVGDGSRAQVGLVHTEELIAPVQCEALDAATALQVARRLAPVVDVGVPVQDESDVPRSVSVVTLLGREAADEADQVLNRWRENGSLVDRSHPAVPRDQPGDLRAIVGHTGIDPFILDLRGEGPHALVGGTTGSGKSEFLQAWVLGLAHAYSPDRVTFLFVDYKGGAAFEKFKSLPHYVGMVTDLTPYLVRRALRSLRAEIRHREVLLHERGVKDLVEFELTGDPKCPPSLVIVVDEFAALAGEVPEFVEGVVDVAQRGRSLGLHLIMATQRPAGVINDSLRANTNLRVALRMNDDPDSIDVLGDKMAARFDPAIPGRGAARTGPGRLVQFQSAYPGARTYPDPPAPPIEIMGLEFGAGRPWKIAATAQSGPKPAKDIDRVVASLTKAAVLGAVPRPRRPWLDTLAGVYDLEKLRQRTDAELVLGVMDDPDEQRQVIMHFRPDEYGNILYIGTSGSGKTSGLRTLAIAAGITPRGGPVHVYGLDFGGGGLSMLEPLPYVGAIVPGNDDERVGRLLRLIGKVLDERAARYSAQRASNLPEYRALAGRQDEPRVLLLLDGFSLFRDEYDSTPDRTVLFDMFRRILSEGRALGVHVAMTVDRALGVPVAFRSAFQQRLVLRQTSEEGYLDADVPKDVLTPQSPPGRGMLADQPEELQLAVLGSDPSPLAQARLIERMAQEIDQFVTRLPEPVNALPSRIPPSEMPDSVAGLPVLGVESESLLPMGFDPRGTVVLVGPRQSGRTTALLWFAQSLRRWAPGLRLIHLSPRRTQLARWGGWDTSHQGVREVGDILRDQLMAQLDVESSTDAQPAVALFVEDLPEFDGTDAEDALLEAIGACRRYGHPIFLDAESSEAGGYSELLSNARKGRAGFLLQPETNDDNLLQTPLGRCSRTEFPPGRGFWVKAGRVWRVQLPLVEP